MVGLESPTSVETSTLASDHLHGLCPDLAAAVADYYPYVASIVDPATVELCRLRIAQITGATEWMVEPATSALDGGVTPDLLAALADWRDSDRFDATQKACLEYAEYFCYSAQAVTDQHVANLQTRISVEKILGLTVACWLSDSFSRLSNFLKIVPHEARAA